MKKVLIYSGGLDSTVLLYKLIADGNKVECLGVDYHQRHKRELFSAAKICDNLGVNFYKIELPIDHILGQNSLTSPFTAVPDGHYEEEKMKVTVVPNRNMIMLSMGIALAITKNAEAVCYAAHSGDHAIYPDCRDEFATAMDSVARLSHFNPIRIDRPFIGMTKTDIVKLGHSLGVDFASTWSCYKGGTKHCGTCGTCVERKEAFVLAEVLDPTEYL